MTVVSIENGDRLSILCHEPYRLIEIDTSKDTFRVSIVPEQNPSQAMIVYQEELKKKKVPTWQRSVR